MTLKLVRKDCAPQPSTAEYNRDLHRENARLETLIDYNREQLRQLDDQIKKAERRMKGLTTMIVPDRNLLTYRPLVAFVERTATS